MSACQICGEPMIALSEVTTRGEATLVVCSRWQVHPAAFFGIDRLGKLRQWRSEHQTGAPLGGVMR